MRVAVGWQDEGDDGSSSIEESFASEDDSVDVGEASRK